MDTNPFLRVFAPLIWLNHMKHSYLGFRFTIFFSDLTKSYKHSNSKGTIYLNNPTTIWIFCALSFFFAKFVVLLFFLRPPPVFLMSTSIMWRAEFQLRKILFFWARFRTSHEGFGTKSYNLVLFWSLCLFFANHLPPLINDHLNFCWHFFANWFPLNLCSGPFLPTTCPQW